MSGARLAWPDPPQRPPPRAPTRKPRAPSDVETDRAIGRRLMEFRRAAGLSQAKAGEAIGVTFQQVRKYEAGMNSVSLRKALALCAAFGREVPELYEGLRPAGPLKGKDRSIRRMKLAGLVLDLGDEELAVVEAVAKALGKRAKQGKGEAA